MLTLENICVTFQDQQVLQSFSCTLDRGDFVVLLGPNGAGKSTLMDTISGKVLPQSGRILLDGKDITHIPENKRSQWIGRLFQNTYLGISPALTVRENLSLAMLRNKRPTLRKGISLFPEEKIKEMSSHIDFDFYRVLDTTISQLSGGQRQIISFIMVMLTNPKILLLDEPTAALDPSASQKVMELVKHFFDIYQTPTLFITHDLGLEEKFGNKTWTMTKGRLV